MNKNRLFIASCLSLLTTSMVFVIRGDVEGSMSAALVRDIMDSNDQGDPEAQREPRPCGHPADGEPQGDGEEDDRQENRHLEEPSPPA